jgi:hypothetical protein
MSESECDRKTQRDLASAISNNTKACHFEPDWRPTNIKERTLHVSDVNRTIIVIAIEGKNYTLLADDYRNSACRDFWGRDCSPWKPEVDRNYPATVINEPRYVNVCLQRVLPAKREVCIGFGKMKQETLPYGVSRTSEFTVCYGLPTD